MKIFKNKLFAIIVMFVMIFCAIGFGSYRNLSELSNETTSTFYNGVNNDGKSIQSNLDQRISTANILVNMAKKYFPSNDETIIKVSDAIGELSNATTPATKCSANKKLTQETDDLIYKLNSESKLSSADSKNLTKFSEQMSVYNDLINKDGYNTVAQNYNNTIDAFPTNLICMVLGVESAQLFR